MYFYVNTTLSQKHTNSHIKRSNHSCVRSLVWVGFCSIQYQPFDAVKYNINNSFLVFTICVRFIYSFSIDSMMMVFFVRLCMLCLFNSFFIVAQCFLAFWYIGRTRKINILFLLKTVWCHFMFFFNKTRRTKMWVRFIEIYLGCVNNSVDVIKQCQLLYNIFCLPKQIWFIFEKKRTFFSCRWKINFGCIKFDQNVVFTITTAALTSQKKTINVIFEMGIWWYALLIRQPGSIWLIFLFIFHIHTYAHLIKKRSQ